MKEIFVKTKQDLWQWLMANHQLSESVWLVHYKKTSGKGDVAYSDVVDICLCFGWIDSVKGKVDDERTKFRISPRNPKSAWSRINKEKVAQLEKAGLMQAAGLAMVAMAKANGAWSKLDAVERCELPSDFEKVLVDQKLLAVWQKKSLSAKRMDLYKLLNMKGQETRAKAIKKMIDTLQTVG